LVDNDPLRTSGEFLMLGLMSDTLIPSADILQKLLMDGRLPGLSVAVVRHGEITQIAAMGARNAATGAPIEARTIFEAASLSKPMFAYAVLQLVDAGAYFWNAARDAHS
jgi:CubicO group peptidase (beta-lactamase class C family)